MNLNNSNAPPRLFHDLPSSSAMRPLSGISDDSMVGNTLIPQHVFRGSHSIPQSLIYYGDCPRQLSTEFTTTYEYTTNNEVLPQSKEITAPFGSTTLSQYYEILQSYENTNPEVLNKNMSDSSGDDPYNFNGYNHKKRGSAKDDDNAKNVHKIKSSQVLKNLSKYSTNGHMYASFGTTFANAQVQTEPIIQRNVCLQTYPPSYMIETDFMDNDDDIKGINEHDCSPKTLKRNAAIQNMQLFCGHINLNDVVGLNETKIIIRETFFLPLTHPHLYNSLHGSLKRCYRCLLYGPPGTGKTLLAKAIASDLGANMYYISCASILSCFIGESEKNVQDLFEFVLGQLDPSVIFFDEIDSVCRKRSEGESEHSRRLKTELLKYFECPGMENSQVYIISATNCPWDLDPAFLRRFQRHIYIPMPDRFTRQQIISKHLGNINSLLTENHWNKMLSDTEGFSASDLMNFISIALAQPNREILLATHWKCLDGEHVTPCDPSDPDAFTASFDDIPPQKVTARCVELRDFIKAAQNTPRTVSQEHIQQFEKFKNLGC